MKIGVFDSGLGGLTILRGILDELPEYDYIYLGDNARVPYGGKSSELIYKFTTEAVDYLFKNDCKLIVVACNTVSATALRKLQQDWLPKKYPDRRVLGVLVPAIEAVAESGAKRLGLIGTYATVHSDYFTTELEKRYPDKKIKVIKQACPLLVPIIEEGETAPKILNPVLEKYLDPLTGEKIDTLLLGCTHYEILKDQIKKVVGPSVNVISEGEIIGLKLREYLKKHLEIEKNLDKNSNLKVLVTDLSQRYKKMARMFIGTKTVELYSCDIL